MATSGAPARDVVSSSGSRPSPGPLLVAGSVVAPVAPPPPRPQPSARYRELNSHVGIAVLAIVVFNVYQFCNVDHFLYHGTPAFPLLNSLDAAVPWFFVLTAFVVFEPIARAVIDGSATTSTQGFLTRPAIRLLPVYYVVVLVVWFSRQQDLPGDWRDLVEHLTFTQVFDQQRIFYTDGPAWAVSVIVFFYLAMAVLRVGFARLDTRLTTRGQRTTALAVTAAALAAVSLSWKTYAYAVEHRSTAGSFTTWFGPVANLDNFAIGMALAIVVAALGRARLENRRLRTMLRCAGLAILVTAFVTRQASGWATLYFSTQCALGFGCLIAGAIGSGAPARHGKLDVSRPFAALGLVAVSVYLWHEPILLVLSGWHGVVRQAPDAFVQDSLVVIALSILTGWLSYLLFERPAKQLLIFLSRDRRRASAFDR